LRSSTTEFKGVGDVQYFDPATEVVKLANVNGLAHVGNS
jgi:hypothetical protein